MNETAFYVVAFLVTGLGSISLLFYGIRQGRLLEMFVACVFGVLCVAFYKTGELGTMMPVYFGDVGRGTIHFFQRFWDAIPNFLDQMKDLYHHYTDTDGGENP